MVRVLRSGGSRALAFGMHGLTGLVIVATAACLIIGAQSQPISFLNTGKDYTMTTPNHADLVKLGYLFAEIMSGHDVSRFDEIKSPH